MAQTLLGGRSAAVGVNAGTDLDPMFSENYAWRELVATPAHSGYSAFTPLNQKFTVDSSFNLIVNGTTVTGIGVGADKFAVNGSVGLIAQINFKPGAGLPFELVNRETSGGWNLYSGAAVIALQADSGGNVRPGTDNSKTLGGASNRWSVVYAGTGTINTSDAREKTAVEPLSPAELAAARALAGAVGSFAFLDAIAGKGSAARRHIGLTVQGAMDIMRAHGLDPLRYGFICHDAWPARSIEHPPVLGPHESQVDEQGAPLQVVQRPGWTEVIPAGDRYAFRPDELLLFLARGFDARLAALEAGA